MTKTEGKTASAEGQATSGNIGGSICKPGCNGRSHRDRPQAEAAKLKEVVEKEKLRSLAIGLRPRSPKLHGHLQCDCT
ncbi:hypothetical protein [Sinorhizobium meliloti]|nr:hypothetical protein U8C39_36415 [Sinorhizobium meliloti]WQP20195.1 hypothetical protein U8C33_35255 [Sinorhizobium meliloti]WQP36158.1 hypothetical protein U8C45_37305 [Sinorhizobium meliloti]